MNNKIANQIASFRTRLACLDLPEHRQLWENQPPAVFTHKVGLIRAALSALADAAARQSIPTTGTAADKRRVEKELEDTAFAAARALVTHAVDLQDLTLAHKFDQPLSAWRSLRNEMLLQRARLLLQDATAATTANLPTPSGHFPADYGLDSTLLAGLSARTDSYAALIAAPQETISSRTLLTAGLPEQCRAIAALFDQIENLLPQFPITPEGIHLAAAYQASAQIIQRGHHSAAEPESPGDPETPSQSPVF